MTIYALLDPRTSTIRYVGRTVDLESRLRGHTGAHAAPLVRAWVDELRAAGLEPTVEVLETCADDVAPQREAHWISACQGPSLLNVHGFVRLPVRAALAGHVMRRVAIESVCCERSVKRYLDGANVNDYTRVRIERALRKLGLAGAVRAVVAS